MIQAAGFRYIPKGAIKIADKQSDAVAYLYGRASDGQPCAKVFYGKQSKPVLNAVFGSTPTMPAAKLREQRVGQYFQYRRDALARKVKQRAERAAKGRGVEVGNFLAASWGYEQTNVDFYKVTKLIGRTMAEVVKVGAIDVGKDETGMSMASYVIPAEEPLQGAEPMRVVIKEGGAKIKGQWASVWNGQPRYVSWYA